MTSKVYMSKISVKDIKAKIAKKFSKSKSSDPENKEEKKGNEGKRKGKTSRFRKVAKVVGICILVPILLLFLIIILLYIPPVQRFVVNTAAEYASEASGMNITIGYIRLSFPLSLRVEDVNVTQQNKDYPQLTDTIADIGEVKVDVKLLPLLRAQVEIDAVEVDKMKFNTVDMVGGMRINGTVDRLYAASHGIDLSQETVRIDKAELSDADLSIVMTNDTVPEDTTESEMNWVINVDDIDVTNTGITLLMSGDTLEIGADMGNLTASNGSFDLGKGLYEIEKVRLKDGGITYDDNYQPRLSGFDASHIQLADVNISIDSLMYCDPSLRLRVTECSLAEKSGLAVTSFTTTVGMDSTSLYLPDMKLRTAASAIDADVEMALSTFDDADPGVMDVTVNAAIAKTDILIFLADMPEGFKRQWPNSPLEAKAVIRGNMQELNIAGIYVNLPTAFKATAKGTAGNLTDTDRLVADLDVEAETGDLTFVKYLIADNGDAGFNIPNNISLTGDVQAAGSKYMADVTVKESSGVVTLNGDIDINAMRYTADVKASDVNIDHFLPNSGMGTFTGSLAVNGVGTDVMARSTNINLDAGIETFDYGEYDLDNVTATATVKNGVINGNVVSDNSLMKGSILLAAHTTTSPIEATVTADVLNCDLYNLRVTDSPLRISICGNIDLKSDMNQYYAVNGNIGDITLRTEDKVYRPEDIDIDMLTNRDTTYATLETGDFTLDMDADGGYEYMLKCVDAMLTLITNDLENKRIDYVALRKEMPDMRINMNSGKENSIYRFVEYAGMSFNEAEMNITSSPDDGLNGEMHIYGFATDSMRFDTISLVIASTETNLEYHAHVQNGDSDPETKFNAFLDGAILEHGLNATARFYDKEEELGLKFGIEGTVENDGIKLSVLTDEPVLGYKKFTVNDGNYIFLGSDRRIRADLSMVADDGQSIQLHSNDANTDALQDLTLTLERFDLEATTSIVPYMPQITGTLDGEVNVVLTKETLTASASMAVDSMTYEGQEIGDVAAAFVYTPTSEGSHTIEGSLKHNDNTVATLSGTVSPTAATDDEESDYLLDAQLNTSSFPMSIVNGFIPDQLIGFRGECNGGVSVTGLLSSPQVDGNIELDSCYLFSTPYGIELRFCEDPISITASQLTLNGYRMYANNENPLTINGNIDFSNLDAMSMDLMMNADNFLLIDAKETKESVAYGKAFVDFIGRINGTLDKLNMSGKLEVLATTDVAYVLAMDTPLTQENQLEGLVEFTDFTDTIEHVVTRPVLEGFSMDLTVTVDDGAHVMCYLNSDHSNYLDIMGGGDLRMTYDAANDLSLIGSFTLNSGEMKYSLPIIPLKTFTIEDGSYIEFTGDPYNPTLSISAVENVKTTVSSDGGDDGRMVEFECGVAISKTLADMGLEFTIDAPEDLTIHNELATMSVEQRGKLAVTMLTTGMYLADGNTSGFSMNNALSSYLQNEISNLTGNALRSLDLSFGIDNATDASGESHTDYTFKFAKRFWNNRLNIIIGGKVTSGSETDDQNDSFLDNVTFEYRLDNTANKYVSLYYDNNAYDWLEGNTSEYGVGFIWRRTLQHFKDIFKFKNDDNKTPEKALTEDVNTAVEATEGQPEGAIIEEKKEENEE